MNIKMNNVTKIFESTTAVDQLNVELTNGVYGLLGANGAGKTTMMRMMCTLIRPTSGVITCEGQEIWKMDGEYRKKLGYLPQDFGYYPEFSAEDYLMYIASIKGLRPSTARKRAKILLQKVALYKVRKKKIKTFSGGMKRRLGIAQALLNDPELLILDEPTAGLDPNERIRFRSLISEIAEDRVVLISTHVVSDVEHIANQILLMKEGKMIGSGTADELIENTPVKAWKCLVNKKEIPAYANNYKITDMKSSGTVSELRILSEVRPKSDAEEEPVVLEDVFIYYAGEENDHGVL